jgi:hypothetical protein
MCVGVAVTAAAAHVVAGSPAIGQAMASDHIPSALARSSSG